MGKSLSMDLSSRALCAVDDGVRCRAAAGVRALAGAAQVGGMALAIDAKDEKAARWSARFGAMTLLDSSPLSLILPFKIILDALGAAQRE